MLRPSYSDLMESLTEQGNIDSSIASRYTIVIASAKRARQIIDETEPLSAQSQDKAVSVAVKELFEGQISITPSSESDMAIHDENVVEIVFDETLL